jgi:hypothetical protein
VRRDTGRRFQALGIRDDEAFEDGEGDALIGLRGKKRRIEDLDFGAVRESEGVVVGWCRAAELARCGVRTLAGARGRKPEHRQPEHEAADHRPRILLQTATPPHRHLRGTV